MTEQIWEWMTEQVWEWTDLNKDSPNPTEQVWEWLTTLSPHAPKYESEWLNKYESEWLNTI